MSREAQNVTPPRGWSKDRDILQNQRLSRPPHPGDFNDPRNRWLYFKNHGWWRFNTALREIEDVVFSCFIRVMLWVCLIAVIFCTVMFFIALTKKGGF